MTAWQKAIKYAAAAFAIFLCISIIGGILSTLATVTVLFDSGDSIGENESYIVGDGINSIDIDISAAEFHITSGDAFTVETNNKNVEISEKNGTLYIKEKKGFFNTLSGKSVLTVYLPTETEFKTANISTGAGKVDIDRLVTQILEMDLGAGKMTAAQLTATVKASIEGGAGKIDIGGGELCNLDLDMGVGELILISKLTGQSDLEMGIGSATLLLDDTSETYKIKIDKGIGRATVDGIEVTDGYVYSNGDNIINIDGGIGSIDINFESKKQGEVS